MTDQEIITTLKKNDIKGGTMALKILYKSNYFMVENYIIKNNGTKDDAKDIFQESVIALYKNLKKENFVLSVKLSTYLYSISRNLWLKKLRDSRMTSVDIADHRESFINEDNIIGEIEYSEHQILIGKMLQKAGERCKKILKAFYYEKLSMKKIALEQGYSNEQIAKNQKFRCLKKIRTVLNNSEYLNNNLKNNY